MDDSNSRPEEIRRTLEAILSRPFVEEFGTVLHSGQRTQVLGALRAMQSTAHKRLLQHSIGVGGWIPLEKLAEVGIDTTVFEGFAQGHAKTIPKNDTGYFISPANASVVLEAFPKAQGFRQWLSDFVLVNRLALATAEISTLPDIAANGHINPYLFVPDGFEWLYVTAKDLNRFGNTTTHLKVQQLGERHKQLGLPDPFGDKIGQGHVGSPYKWLLTPFNALLAGVDYTKAHAELGGRPAPEVPKEKWKLSRGDMEIELQKWYSRSFIRDLVTRIHGSLTARSETIAQTLCPEDRQLGVYIAKTLHSLVGMRPLSTATILDLVSAVEGDRETLRGVFEKEIQANGKLCQYRHIHALVPNTPYVLESEFQQIVSDFRMIVKPAGEKKLKPKSAPVMSVFVSSEMSNPFEAKSQYENWARQKGFFNNHPRSAGVLYDRRIVDMSNIDSVHRTYQAVLQYMLNNDLMLIGIIPTIMRTGVQISRLQSDVLDKYKASGELEDLCVTFMKRPTNLQETCYACKRDSHDRIMDAVREYSRRF